MRHSGALRFTPCYTYSSFFTCAGYQGYIPGVISENCIGVRYTKSSAASANNALPRGIEQSVQERYQTTSRSDYMHHDDKQHPNVSQTLNLNRPQDTYKKVSRWNFI